MVKLLSPALSIEARGSLGGICYSRNTMGAYARAKASPVQPRTAVQQERRYDFQKLVRAYQDLNPVQIAAWVQFAKDWPRSDVFGHSINHTGLDWYVGLNARLMAIDVASKTSPPLNPNSNYTPVMTITQDIISTGDIKITYDTAPAGNERIWVHWSSHLPRSSLFAKKSLRLRDKVDSSDSSPFLLIDYYDLSRGDSLIQFIAFAVDVFGRATTKQRYTVWPASMS